MTYLAFLHGEQSCLDYKQGSQRNYLSPSKEEILSKTREMEVAYSPEDNQKVKRQVVKIWGTPAISMILQLESEEKTKPLFGAYPRS